MQAELCGVEESTECIPGWTNFGDLVTTNGYYQGQVLPPRLRGPFLERPWPLQDLGAGIIDTRYVTLAPPEASNHRCILEILGRFAITIDGRHTELVKNKLPLRMLNIMLLTRGHFIRADEFKTLIAPTPLEKYPDRPFTSARKHLAADAATVLFIQHGGERHTASYQLHPGVRIVDKRPYNSAGPV